MMQHFRFHIGETRLIGMVGNSIEPQSPERKEFRMSLSENAVRDRANVLFAKAEHVQDMLSLSFQPGSQGDIAKNFQRRWDELKETYWKEMSKHNLAVSRQEVPDAEAFFRSYLMSIEGPLRELEQLLKQWEGSARPSERVSEKELETTIEENEKKTTGNRRFRTRYDKATKTSYWEEYDPDKRSVRGKRRNDMGSKTIAESRREAALAQAENAGDALDPHGPDALNREMARRGIGGAGAEIIRRQNRESESMQRRTGGARLDYSAPESQRLSRRERLNAQGQSKRAGGSPSAQAFSASYDTVSEHQKPIEYTFSPEVLRASRGRLVQLIAAGSDSLLPNFVKFRQWRNIRHWNPGQMRLMEVTHRDIVAMAHGDTLGIKDSEERSALLKAIVPSPRGFPKFVADVLTVAGIDPDSVPAVAPETGRMLPGGWKDGGKVLYPPNFPAPNLSLPEEEPSVTVRSPGGETEAPVAEEPVEEEKQRTTVGPPLMKKAGEKIDVPPEVISLMKGMNEIWDTLSSEPLDTALSKDQQRELMQNKIRGELEKRPKLLASIRSMTRRDKNASVLIDIKAAVQRGDISTANRSCAEIMKRLRDGRGKVDGKVKKDFADLFTEKFMDSMLEDFYPPLINAVTASSEEWKLPEGYEYAMEGGVLKVRKAPAEVPHALAQDSEYQQNIRPKSELQATRNAESGPVTTLANGFTSTSENNSSSAKKLEFYNNMKQLAKGGNFRASHFLGIYYSDERALQSGDRDILSQEARRWFDHSLSLPHSQREHDDIVNRLNGLKSAAEPDEKK